MLWKFARRSIVATRLLAGAGVLATFAACTHSTPSSAASACNTDPFSCGPGKTCLGPLGSIASGGLTFVYECVASGTGKEGDTCQDTFGTPDATTCGEGLYCYQSQSRPGPARCVAFCDAAHACASPSAACSSYPGDGSMPSVRVCLDPRVPADAGAADASK